MGGHRGGGGDAPITMLLDTPILVTGMEAKRVAEQ